MEQFASHCHIVAIAADIQEMTQDRTVCSQLSRLLAVATSDTCFFISFRIVRTSFSHYSFFVRCPQSLWHYATLISSSNNNNNWWFWLPELLTCPGWGVDHSAVTTVWYIQRERTARWVCCRCAWRDGAAWVRVIGILVIPYAVVSDDVGDQAAVDCKQQRAKHRSLRDAHVNFSDIWFMLAHLDELGGSGNCMTGTTVRLWNNCKTEWWRPKSWFWGQAKATVSEAKSFSFFYLQWNVYSLRVSAA